jgi:hypothetical protein
MANSSTVYTAAETKEFFEDTSTNAAIKPSPGNSTGRRNFHLTLVIAGGVEITPLEIYAALDTKFEAISCDKKPHRRSAELVIHKTSETVSLEQGENPESNQ